tara:strand:- start:5812 stop:6057 length:246 start_codon:yes stop_codon:yes gene_type:complete
MTNYQSLSFYNVSFLKQYCEVLPEVRVNLFNYIMFKNDLSLRTGMQINAVLPRFLKANLVALNAWLAHQREHHQTYSKRWE